MKLLLVGTLRRRRLEVRLVRNETDESSVCESSSPSASLLTASPRSMVAARLMGETGCGVRGVRGERFALLPRGEVLGDRRKEVKLLCGDVVGDRRILARAVCDFERGDLPGLAGSHDDDDGPGTPPVVYACDCCCSGTGLLGGVLGGVLRPTRGRGRVMVSGSRNLPLSAEPEAAVGTEAVTSPTEADWP